MNLNTISFSLPTRQDQPPKKGSEENVIKGFLGFWVQNWSYFERQLPEIITCRYACMEVANTKRDFEKRTYFHA
jgi:hypothetical protein